MSHWLNINTYINENDNISSGMKQLVVLMQNIVSKAPILVFDEATNMLDEKIPVSKISKITFLTEEDINKLV